jgi:hypothetical protein
MLNAEALTGATQTFISTLDEIEGKHEASKSRQETPVLEPESTDLTAKKDAIISGYNNMLDFINTAIGQGKLGDLCKAAQGGKIEDYIAAFNTSIDSELSSATDAFRSTQPYKDNVKKITSKFIENIEDNDSGKKFGEIVLFCRILKQQVQEYRSLTTQLETLPSDDSKKQQYIEMIKGGIDAFIAKILQAPVKLDGANSTDYAFKLVRPAAPAAKKGGSNSSRKHNSRKKGHRKSSSKARKSRRNTRSSSTSKNHKKVRFVKTS